MQRKKASWEGFILEQLITHLDVDSEQTYFWGTHGVAELDLYVPRGQKGIGFEIKRTTTPKLTASIHAAMDALAVREIVVVHAGDDSYALAKNVRAVSASRLTDDL